MNTAANRIYCLEPVVNHMSRILILGTIPGPESLSSKTYYANPTNHFWDFMYRILVPEYPPYQVFDTTTPREARYQLLLAQGIALWDTLSDCIRDGSSDNNILDAHYNDIYGLVMKHGIEHIVCSSPKAAWYLRRSPQYGRLASEAVKTLNSTSTQNPQNTFCLFHQWKTAFASFLSYPLHREQAVSSPAER